MRDAGYTLAEMLAALMIVGLAIGGLSAGLGVLGRLQSMNARAVGALQATHIAQVGLRDLLSSAGPFRALDVNGLQGDAAGLQFPCGAARCRARLLPPAGGGARLELTAANGRVRTMDLRDPGPLAFSYVGGLGPSPTWPPAGGERQALRAVSLLRRPNGSAAEPVLEARIWREQPAACDFDVVMQDCR